MTEASSGYFINRGLPPGGFVMPPQMDGNLKRNVLQMVTEAQSNPSRFVQSELKGGDGAVIIDDARNLAIKLFHTKNRSTIGIPSAVLANPIDQYNALSLLNERTRELHHPNLSIRFSEPYYADESLLVMEKVPTEYTQLSAFLDQQKGVLKDDYLIAKALGWIILRYEEHSRLRMRSGKQCAQILSGMDPNFPPTFDQTAQVLGSFEALCKDTKNGGRASEFFFTSLLTGPASRNNDSGHLVSMPSLKSARQHLFVHNMHGHWNIFVIDPIVTTY